MAQGVSKVSTPCDQDRNDKAEEARQSQMDCRSARSQPNVPPRANDKKSHADTEMRTPLSNTRAQ
jgi:hypothetical protein